MMKKELVSTMVIAIAIIIAMGSIATSINHIAYKDRAVTVKGLCTREVKADYAVWPLQFSVEGNDIATIERNLVRSTATLREYLESKGFAAEDIQQGYINVEDNWSNYYEHRPENHYTASTSLIVSTTNVDLVIACQNYQSELLSKGIVVSTSQWSLDYQFNGLNAIKPEMIEQATMNARMVAQKFADDAHCRLGSIRQANQGQFSVDNDSYQPWVKHIRVVTTVSYYLK